MSRNRESYFWTKERLTSLVEALQKVGVYEQHVWHLGREALPPRVHAELIRQGWNISLPQTASGLYFLVRLGVLEPGKRGPKRRGSGYRREFHPYKIVSVTPQDIRTCYDLRDVRTRRKN